MANTTKETGHAMNHDNRDNAHRMKVINYVVLMTMMIFTMVMVTT